MLDKQELTRLKWLASAVRSPELDVSIEAALELRSYVIGNPNKIADLLGFQDADFRWNVIRIIRDFVKKHPFGISVLDVLVEKGIDDKDEQVAGLAVEAVILISIHLPKKKRNELERKLEQKELGDTRLKVLISEAWEKQLDNIANDLKSGNLPNIMPIRTKSPPKKMLH